jgi:hypothetical protein
MKTSKEICENSIFPLLIHSWLLPVLDYGKIAENFTSKKKKKEKIQFLPLQIFEREQN